MAARGLFNASDLKPLLAERGITLSSVQVWRLVTHVPERLSLPVLSALCDILETTPANLVVATAKNASVPLVASADAGPRRSGRAPAPPRDTQAAVPATGSARPYKRTCGRCGNFRFAHALLSDGHICQSCLITELRT
jgi:DNA-binding Xre family transcriptional regulator